MLGYGLLFGKNIIKVIMECLSGFSALITGTKVFELETLGFDQCISKMKFRRHSNFIQDCFWCYITGITRFGLIL
jgi:hypothetical protein